MTQANPRISISVTPATNAVISRLCELTGQSKSSAIAQILEQSEPVFSRMIRLIEKMQQATSEVSNGFASGLEKVQTTLEAQMGLAIDDLERETDDLFSSVEKVKRRRKRGAAADAERGAATLSDPRALTGGSPNNHSHKNQQLSKKTGSSKNSPNPRTKTTQKTTQKTNKRSVKHAAL